MKKHAQTKSSSGSSVESFLPYRFFWTWDHSTNWCLNTLGTQNCGVGNYYTKKGDVFVKDYMRAVDWCSAHGMSAIGIVGLLRDSHGGMDSARKICAYARDHGVRIYLIAGLYSYGGIYYEGDSPLSLDRFLDSNPDCLGKTMDGKEQFVQFAYPHGYKRQPAACPSNRKLRDFVLDSLDYVFHALPELGGIQMETGDSLVCLCEQCRERRAAMQGGEERVPFISFSDMADIYPAAAEVIWARSPDAWVICETYTHFLNNPVFSNLKSPALQAMLKMPEKTFWQWSDRHLAPDAWTTKDHLPAPLRKFRHIMRAHHGTQWDGGRHTLAVDEIRKQCRLTSESGMQGVSIFGESAPYHTNSEFNYLALQYFADHPMDSLHSFAENVMAPLLGGSASTAKKYLEFGSLNKHPDKIPEAVREISRIIPAIKKDDALRRWYYLSSFLNSFYWESTHSCAEKPAQKVNLDKL